MLLPCTWTAERCLQFLAAFTVGKVFIAAITVEKVFIVAFTVEQVFKIAIAFTVEIADFTVEKVFIAAFTEGNVFILLKGPQERNRSPAVVICASSSDEAI